MDPTQTPQVTPPAVDLSGIEKMIGDLQSSVDTKMGEMDSKVADLVTENADLKKYITDGGGASATATPPAAEQPAWKPQSWDDFPKLVEEKANEIVANTIKNANEENQRLTAEQTRVQGEIDREIDNQLDKLTKDGILPPVTNPRDPNDPGNAARKELLALGVALETPNLEQVANNVLVPQHEAGSRFDPTTAQWLKSDRPLPGRYAPVGSSSSRTTSAPSGPSYDVISKARSMDDLIAYADQHGYGPAPTQA